MFQSLSKSSVILFVLFVVFVVQLTVSKAFWPSFVRLLSQLRLILVILIISYALGLVDKPVKDLMRIGLILRIMIPTKLHLLHTWRHIPSLNIKERLRFAFGRESFNRCLLLSFNLFFLGRPFLFLLWCTESLIKIRELFINKVTRVKFRAC